MNVASLFSRVARTKAARFTSSPGNLCRFRRFMATNNTEAMTAPPFTTQVVTAMRSLYPEELADRSWDNVGLLLENTQPPLHNGAPQIVPARVLLTNDLTIRVAQEAIRKRASVIVTYHPFIFRGLKSITLSDPHQHIVILLMRNNIAVYSPHTAVDAAPGGLNDWLADMLDGHKVSTTRSVVKPITAPLPQGFDGAGYGRLVQFGHPVNMGRIVEEYARRLGGLRHVMVAYPRDAAKRTSKPTGPPIVIRSVGICAGSGSDVLSGCDADLLVTGEMSHHAALRLTMQGKCVLTVFHSNSERQFLTDKMKPDLEKVLRRDADAATEVLVSEEDEDPFEIWDVENMPEWAYI